jgi:hypothetical protein
MEPIQVLFSGSYYVMIDVEDTSAILVDAVGVMSAVAIASVTVVDPNIFSKAKYINNNPPNTP